MSNLPDRLFHWTERRNINAILGQGLAGPVYLTENGEDPDRGWNESIIWLYRPARITIDAFQLDLSFLKADQESLSDYADETGETVNADMSADECLRLTGNLLHDGSIPAEAIVEISYFAPREGWKMYPWIAQEHGYTTEDMTAFGERDDEDWRQRLSDRLAKMNPVYTRESSRSRH